MPYGQYAPPSAQQRPPGGFSPAINTQRNNITSALMNIARPPPQTPMPQMPPNRSQMGLPQAQVPGLMPNGPPTPQAPPVSGVLPQGAPTPGMPPPNVPLSAGVPPNPMQAAGAPPPAPGAGVPPSPMQAAGVRPPGL